MTKTQALQRLYKALTGNEGRNTGSKVIEDLAIAAENGEIGGGGKIATVTFSASSTAVSNAVTVDTCAVVNGAIIPTGNVALSEIGSPISLPVIENGTFLQLGNASGYTVTITGDAENTGNNRILVYGDCTISISSGGK